MHRDCRSGLYDFFRSVNSQEREQVMEEKKSMLQEMTSDYDAADRLFDFVEEKTTTALVCEPDPVTREKISESLKELGYKVMTATTAKDALKALWFFVFDVVVINELFDAADPQAESVLNYLQEMPMATRRRSFVALLNARFRTMDNMAAFNQSVNSVINLKNIDELGKIIRQGVAENNTFYHVFRASLQKVGKV
jgi:CheY-like chemotaxis protein